MTRLSVQNSIDPDPTVFTQWRTQTGGILCVLPLGLFIGLIAIMTARHQLISAATFSLVSASAELLSLLYLVMLCLVHVCHAFALFVPLAALGHISLTEGFWYE